MYMYVVVLNQNAPMVKKNFILGHRLEEGGTTCFQFFSREEQKIFKAAWEGGQMFFQHMFPI